MTIQTVAIIGAAIGLLCRTLLPFAIACIKGRAKWADYDFAHLKVLLWGTVPAAAGGYGVPAWLTAHGIAETSAIFTPLVGLVCAGISYFGQDQIREWMKPNDVKVQAPPRDDT